MRDLAWPSVKLFAPAAGAPGLLALGLATAGVLASGFAGARVFCAPAPCASPTAKTAMAAAVYSAFMDRFLFVFEITRQQAGWVLRSGPKQTRNRPEPSPHNVLAQIDGYAVYASAAL